MANKKDTAKTTVDKAAVEKTTAADIETVEKDEKEEVVETKKETKRKVVEPLEDFDEIKVVSLVPNVSYKDSKTGDMYEWDVVGHEEDMTFETLKNMWRNNKGYFRNMWLKPCDNRVINKFGLTKTFEKYEYLMNADNYTEENIKKICDAISNTPMGMKRAICDRIKNLVIDGKISDGRIIKTLERHLGLELIDFL